MMDVGISKFGGWGDKLHGQEELPISNVWIWAWICFVLKAGMNIEKGIVEGLDGGVNKYRR